MVILLAPVGRDVRRFKQVWKRAPSYEAGVAEAQPESLAECGLPPSCTDLACDDCALILFVGHIRVFRSIVREQQGFRV